MVKLRLIPTGKSVQPSFRIVATDARTKVNGKFIEIVGFYDPIKKTSKINEDLALKFLMNGAQPSNTVRTLLSDNGILTKFHNLRQDRNKLKSQTKKNINLINNKTENAQ